MDTSEVIAGEVRAHVLIEHERLRLLLSDFIHEALQTGRKVGHRRLRERLALLRAAAERAIDVEARELVPLLRSDQSTELYERHARVRTVLDAFEQDVAAGQHHHCDLVARAEQLIDAFSADLREDDELVPGPEATEEVGHASPVVELERRAIEGERLPR